MLFLRMRAIRRCFGVVIVVLRVVRRILEGETMFKRKQKEPEKVMEKTVVLETNKSNEALRQSEPVPEPVVKEELSEEQRRIKRILEHFEPYRGSVSDERVAFAPKWQTEAEKLTFLLAIFAELNMQGTMQASHVEVLHDHFGMLLLKMDELIKAIREA